MRSASASSFVRSTWALKSSAAILSHPAETVAALPGRVATPLRDPVVSESEDVHSARSVRERLRDVGAFGREKTLRLARPLHPRLGGHEARVAASKRADRMVERCQLRLDRDGEWVDRQRRLVGAACGRPFRKGDRCPRDEPGRACDCHRAPCGFDERAFCRVGRAREAPSFGAKDADAHAARAAGRGLFGTAVADAKALAGFFHEAYFGVPHAGLLAQPINRRVKARVTFDHAAVGGRAVTFGRAVSGSGSFHGVCGAYSMTRASGRGTDCYTSAPRIPARRPPPQEARRLRRRTS